MMRMMRPAARRMMRMMRRAAGRMTEFLHSWPTRVGTNSSPISTTHLREPDGTSGGVLFDEKHAFRWPPR